MQLYFALIWAKKFKMKTIRPIYGVLLLFTLSLITFSSCVSPQPVSRLKPMTDNYKWWYGNQLLTFESEKGIVMEMAFKKSTGQHLIFDIWIKNLTGAEVLVSPEAFYYEALRTDTSRLNKPLQYAVNPEKELLELEKREAREIADQSNAFLMEVTSTTLDIASDVTDKNKSEEQKEQERVERQERRDDYSADQEQGDLRLQSLDAQRHYWERSALRKTTLASGYELGGNVFFPRENQAAFLRFHLTIGGEEFSALFRQVLHTP